MVDDKLTIKRFSEAEDRAFRNTLSFLIFLDSFQTNNLPNIAEYITNQGAKNLVSTQNFQEVIHTESYQYILQELYISMDRDSIYNMWRDNPLLKERNETIAKIAQDFVDNPNEDSFIKVCCANLALEGIYFYQGFNLFDQLAHRGMAVGTQDIISYIRVDELTHVSLFINILKELDQEKVKKYIIPIFEDAVEQETKWCHSIYGDDILGITKKSSEQYVRHLADKRLIRLGMEPHFGNPENPYKHLELSQMKGGKRGNFFEDGGITEYDTADTVDGWDEL